MADLGILLRMRLMQRQLVKIDDLDAATSMLLTKSQVRIFPLQNTLAKTEHFVHRLWLFLVASLCMQDPHVQPSNVSARRCICVLAQ